MRVFSRVFSRKERLYTAIDIGTNDSSTGLGYSANNFLWQASFINLPCSLLPQFLTDLLLWGERPFGTTSHILSMVPLLSLSFVYYA